MATTLFFRSIASASTAEFLWSSGAAYTNLAGSSATYRCFSASTTAGTAISNATVSTVGGPTSGVEFDSSGGALASLYISPPLAEDVTISGSITFNLHAAESDNRANAAINCRVMRIKGSDASLTEVIKTGRTTELGTSSAAANFSATPTSTAFNRGDRISLIPFIDDAGTMASGYTVTFGTNAASGSAGYSYVTFNETFSFESAPAGTQVFPTNTAASASINPGAATEYEAWTSRGGGVQSAVTNTTNGPTNAIQVTDTGGGTALEWYTRPLAATTLSGPVLANIRAAESNAAASVLIRADVAVTANDGTGATVWGIGGMRTELTTSEAANQFWIGGDDTSISAGQRLRFRVYIDDIYGSNDGTQTMVTGYTATVYYAGADAATGDTYFTLPISVTEYSAASYGFPFRATTPRATVRR